VCLQLRGGTDADQLEARSLKPLFLVASYRCYRRYTRLAPGEIAPSKRPPPEGGRPRCPPRGAVPIRSRKSYLCCMFKAFEFCIHIAGPWSRLAGNGFTRSSTMVSFFALGATATAFG
jgi:hypothetical protein